MNIETMKKLLLITISIILLNGCCKRRQFVPAKISEKVITQSKHGGCIYFHFLLANGEVLEVEGKEYATKQIGDTCWVYLCVENYELTPKSGYVKQY